MRTNDNTNCPVTDCKLLKWKTVANGLFGTKDVSESYDDETYVKVDTEDKGQSWDLYFKTNYNELGGVDVKRLQLECTNGKQIERSVNQFDYKQNVNPCLQSVSRNNDVATKINEPADMLAIPYSTSTDLLQVANFEKLYNVASPSICALTCGVFAKDCSSTPNTRISLKDNWNLQTVQNYAEGYGPDETCIKCANLDDSFTFNFKAKQILRCHNRLTSLGTSQQDDEGVLKWIEDRPCTGFGAFGNCKTWRTFQDDVFNSYFANKNDDAKCPVTDCKLMKPGCSEDADSINVRMSKSGSKW